MHAALGAAAAVAAAADGHPHCFDGSEVYNYEACCSTKIGPKGDPACWDSLMNFDYCCRPPAPQPARGDPTCWKGALRNKHEVCCHGSGRSWGPRGYGSCWEVAEREGERSLDARRCCDFEPLREGGGPGGAQCLDRSFASTCFHPGVYVRPHVYWDTLEGQQLPVPHGWVESRGPFLRALPAPRRPRGPAHFLTLGVGSFEGSARRLRVEALELGVFDEVFSYTNFSFARGPRFKPWQGHLTAWRERRARIAGFGWWKPALCRRHLRRLPAREGVLVYSDAGTVLPASLAETWREALAVMRRFDVMAIVEVEFEERLYTKRAALRRFAEALDGTGAATEGQFVTRLFALRRTPVVERLLTAWERLVQELPLVDEALEPEGEDPQFAAHRHEQSLWSLLLKCAILGRGVRLEPREPPVNLSGTRVLTLVNGFESRQLATFARQRA